MLYWTLVHREYPLDCLAQHRGIDGLRQKLQATPAAGHARRVGFRGQQDARDAMPRGGQHFGQFEAAHASQPMIEQQAVEPCYVIAMKELLARSVGHGLVIHRFQRAPQRTTNRRVVVDDGDSAPLW